MPVHAISLKSPNLHSQEAGSFTPSPNTMLKPCAKATRKASVEVVQAKTPNADIPGHKIDLILIQPKALLSDEVVETYRPSRKAMPKCGSCTSQTPSAESPIHVSI